MTWRVIGADVLSYLRGNQWMVQNGYLPRYHAVLCDPPYALPGGFMSKDWDNFRTPQAFEAWVREWAELLLDYVYPGALLMAFGGTRTYHRLAAGLHNWRVLRYSTQHVTGDPEGMIAQIRTVLEREAQS